jgi:3-hydroxyisobutyryl-CoA hydrolase
MVLKQEPKWSPSSIDNVSLDYLRSEVFRDGVQLSLPFKHDPNFIPENHLKYVLPTRKNILEAQNQNNLNGLDETVDWFKNKQNNKFGLRQKIESLV